MSLKIYGFVYKTILPDKRIYIGQTTNINWKSYYGSGIKILKYFKYNGFKGVKRKILRNCYSQKELDKWERFFIKKYNSTDESIGLNIQLGGTGRNIFADITKEKISKSVSKTMT